jgi:transposase InsO family protein
MRFEFIEEEKAEFPVRLLCRVLKVSTSGFYAWQTRTPSARKEKDAVLVERIRDIHAKSRGTYGSPRIWAELRDVEAFEVSRKRIARLMQEQELRGDTPKRFRRTTDSQHDFPVAANVLARNFAPTSPDQSWATDITYIWTWEGWLYLAVVIDLFSRRVVGWSMKPHMQTDIVLDALAMALGHRKPLAKMVHHSDRGSQYASNDYREALEKHDIVCSMSRKGNCWDNAVVESFFGTLKTELIYRDKWLTRRQVRSAVVDYIESFYNRRRRHSTLGNISPVEYEETHLPVMKKAA